MREKEVEDLRQKTQLLDQQQKALVDRTRSLNEQVDQKAVVI